MPNKKAKKSKKVVKTEPGPSTTAPVLEIPPPPTRIDAIRAKLPDDFNSTLPAYVNCKGVPTVITRLNANNFQVMVAEDTSKWHLYY